MNANELRIDNLVSNFNYSVQILKDGKWADLCFSDSVSTAIGRAEVEYIEYNRDSRVVSNRTNKIIAEFKQEEQKCMKRILEEIIDRNTRGNYLLSSSDKTQMISEILDLLGVMPRFNLNHEVIIYPNERGFAKIKALIGNKYLLSNEEAETWVNKRKTEDGGYKEQLWVIVSDLHDIFYLGQNYMATMWIALLNEA